MVNKQQQHAEPGPWQSLTPPGWVVAFVAALAALVLYVITLGPTITGEDSGEFVTAAYALGIPHPPGYPLYCLIGHLFTWIPLGEPAWRVNLMSAVFASATVFVLALTVLRLTGSRVAALSAALAFACSREFWAQAVIAEVYTMNIFFIALCFLLLLRWSETRKDTTLYLFAFFFGLGVVVHNTFLLLIPCCVLYIVALDGPALYPERRLRAGRLKTYAICLLISAAAFALYLYLPIRSRANPPLNWGNPETLANAARHVRRVQYDFMFSQYPRSLARFAGQMAVYARMWLGEFGAGLALLVAAVGFGPMMRRHRAFGLLLLAAAVSVLAGFSFWQNFEQTREWLWVMRVFGIPAWYATALFIGFGIARIAQHGPEGRAPAAMLGCILVLIPLAVHFQENNKSDYYWTRDYGANILVSLEQDAIYVSESDHASFSILYLQAVHQMRPDVENLRKYGYLQSDLFEAMPEALRAKIGPFPPRRHDPEIIAWLMDNTDRPVYLANPMPLPTEAPVRYAPAGLAFRALRQGEAPSEYDYWDLYQWHTLSPEDTRGDYTADAIIHEIHKARARALLMSARHDTEQAEALQQEAREEIELGLEAYGRDPVVLNNAGVLCARYGLYNDARTYFEEALELLPAMPEARRNLDRVQNRLK